MFSALSNNSVWFALSVFRVFAIFLANSTVSEVEEKKL